MGLTKVRYKALKGDMNLYDSAGSVVGTIQKGDVIDIIEIVKEDHPNNKKVAILSDGNHVVFEYGLEIFYEPIKRGKK